MLSLLLFLALAAPVQPPALTVEHTPQGNVISWSEIGDIGSDQVLYLMRIRAGANPLALSSWASIHNPPAVAFTDEAGHPCDGYELRLVPGWKTIYQSRCTVFLPGVVSP